MQLACYNIVVVGPFLQVHPRVLAQASSDSRDMSTRKYLLSIAFFACTTCIFNIYTHKHAHVLHTAKLKPRPPRYRLDVQMCIYGQHN